MSKKRKRLEMTVGAIQRRWGLRALRRLEADPAKAAIPHISTGFPTLDKALDGIGGIPRSRLSELLGQPTSGMATLALKIIANAQAEGDTVAYVDLSATFDPDYAHRCDVNLNKLLLVRPQSGLEALTITESLLRSRGTGVLLFDAVPHLMREAGGARALPTLLRQMVHSLSQSPCALIFLTPLIYGNAMSADNYPGGFALPPYAAVRLLIQKERWLHRRRDVYGYEAQVRILKNKLGRAGKQARIAITFNGTVRGDST
jgi:recombination protein RecA